MRPRKLLIALLCFSALIAAVVLAVALKPDHSFAVRVINTAEFGASKDVTVEFQRINPAARFTDSLQVQTRIAGQWQPPKNFPDLGGCNLLGRTNCQRVLFTFPAQADACRFSLAYYATGRPYCRAYFFLARHGLLQRYPKSCHLLLKCVPQQARLRHAEYDLSLPPELHAQRAATI